MSWLASFVPAPTNVSVTERLRASCGALVGIFLTGAVSSWAFGTTLATPMLIAPMGASAVLLFAVPSSPLAQPWSIIGGNLVAGIVGVTASRYAPGILSAASLAIAFAIAGMFVFRCIHPPSGAVALTAVLGGSAVTALGYRFVLWPVLLNSVILAAVAICFNNATRRPYPSPQTRAPESEVAHAALARGFSSADLESVLRDYDQVLDISRSDMTLLFQQAELHAYRRRFGTMTCAEIMSRDAVSVQWGTPLQEAWVTMRKSNLRSMPVVDRANRVIGIVSDRDFLEHAGLERYATLSARFKRFIAPPTTPYTDGHEVVGQIMSKGAATATVDSHIVSLVPLLADNGLDHVPIIDDTRHLVGTIGHGDLISALFQSRFAEA